MVTTDFHICWNLFFVDSIISSNAQVLYGDLYLNTTSMLTVRRIYVFVFSDDQELDGRYSPSIILTRERFDKLDYLESPLNEISNQMPANLVRLRDIQHIAFAGKLDRMVATTLLQDYWQNPMKQGLIDAQVSIIQFNELLAYSSK